MNYLSRRIEVAEAHQESIWSQGVNELEVVEVNGKRLKLADGRELVEFMSCSYLGLDQRAELREAAYKTIGRFGVQMSAARTRMLAAPLRELEELLTDINNGWNSVVFNSVSATHQAVIPLLASGRLPGYPIAPAGPAFVIDRSAHASLQSMRGIMEQFGKIARVDFQDTESFEATCRDLSRSGRTVIAISDSVGSMGGTNDIETLTSITDDIGGFSYFDDAHGTSVFGDKGEGFVLESMNGKPSDRIIWTGSLSKAFGATGGFAAFSNADAASFVKRYSIPYAFGGPPSLPAIGAAVASAHLHLNGTVRELQVQLRRNTALFDELLRAPGVNINSSSPIRGIEIGDEFAVIDTAKLLQERGYAVTTAMYPTVKLGRAMIRLAISASHSSDDIRGVAESINVIHENL